MKSFLGVLIVVAVLAVLVGILWVRFRVVRGNQRKRSKREYVEREAERDRHAVRMATKSRSAGDSAPRDAFVLPDSPRRDASGRRDGGGAGQTPGGQGSESLKGEIDARRRASTSTSFDPDLPSS